MLAITGMKSEESIQYPKQGNCQGTDVTGFYPLKGLRLVLKLLGVADVNSEVLHRQMVAVGVQACGHTGTVPLNCAYNGLKMYFMTAHFTKIKTMLRTQNHMRTCS